jgi:hypothetical protein
VPRRLVALVLLLASCVGHPCEGPDGQGTVPISVPIDEYTRAAGDDGVLGEAECRALCEAWVVALATVDSCEAGVPTEGSVADTGHGYVDERIGVRCGGRYWCR